MTISIHGPPQLTEKDAQGHCNGNLQKAMASDSMSVKDGERN